MSSMEVTPSSITMEARTHHSRHSNSEHDSCWGHCNGLAQCLEKCDEQVQGIGECKANCNFTDPVNGARCIQNCRENHIFQSPVQTTTPPKTELSSRSENTPVKTATPTGSESTATSARPSVNTPNSSTTSSISVFLFIVTTFVSINIQ
ncbi:hypothetical protein K7432_014913 [Basidiobolus ranarum]|uniref:Uncharacterized protein n=1 Tax=Basidiobolus ranarum TaxID=34480 RepID=A0ABR2VPV0_9FUNG